MKNKKWIWICALILVVLAVVLIWKPFGGAANTLAAEEQNTIQETQSQASAAQAAENAPEQTAKEESAEEQAEETAPLLLEDEGDIVIVVPEDQSSGGF